MHKLQPNSLHCFVCGLENPLGLHLRFYKTNPGEVTVDCSIPEQYQGYPGVVHGGILASIVDEALGRAHMGDIDEPRFMYTARLTVKYRKPVPTEEPIRIVGRAVKSKQRSAFSEAVIYDVEGNTLVEAEAILVNLPPDRFEDVDFDALGWKVYPENGE